MKVLVLSGRFGMGHEMAANAICEQFRKIDEQAEIEKKDLLEELYPHISKFIFGGFRMMVEHCYGIYNFIYKMSGRMKVEMQPRGKAIYKKLKKIMDGEQPDVIVCTHPMCVKAIASYKEKTGLKTPLVTCITDISMHPEWTAPQTDIYLAPTQEIKRHLMKEGTRAEDILVTGIPVRQQFLDADYRQKRERNRTRRVLIMGGGLGLMPDLKELLEKLHSMQGVESVVITGKNHKMYEEWVNRYEDVEVLGYTENISRYMRGADLVITKAGGITLFEILHSQVPLFVIHPFLEQEMNNARYAAEKGFAKVIWGRREDYIPEIGSTLTCTGASHVGNAPAKCSIRIPINLSIDPNATRWIMIGRCFSPSAPVYSSSNLCGSCISSWIVPHCHVLPIESVRWKSIFGP